jgi:large subunit ribosomal protein L32
MATPKKKVSRSRRNMRRFSTAYKLDKVTVMTCPSCNEPKRPHTVCKCGYYDGKAVFSAKEAKA